MTSPSDAPARPPGVRARSGNAMLRTRAALLAGASDCVARQGVRATSMTDVAAAAGVAKATLYNHFRTKDDVLAALVEAQVADLAGQCADLAAAQGGEQALVHAARCLAESAPVRRVAAHEPALLVALAAPSDARAWRRAYEGVQEVLALAGADAAGARAELVLRWLGSQLLWPLQEDQAREQARVLLAADALVRETEPTRTSRDDAAAVARDEDPASAVARAGRSPGTSGLPVHALT